jgi:hypothetical protein
MQQVFTNGIVQNIQGESLIQENKEIKLKIPKTFVIYRNNTQTPF